MVKILGEWRRIDQQTWCWKHTKKQKPIQKGAPYDIDLSQHQLPSGYVKIAMENPHFNR